MSFVAAPLNEVAAAVPRPPASAALPHGTAAGVGVTRRAVTLGQTPVDSLDSSRSTSVSTSTSSWRLESNFPRFLETDTECTFSAETRTEGGNHAHVTLRE